MYEDLTGVLDTPLTKEEVIKRLEKAINNTNEASRHMALDYAISLVKRIEADQLQAENAELKARLEKAVELPCKVGDTVYEINDFLGNYKIEEKVITNIGVDFHEGYDNRRVWATARLNGHISTLSIHMIGETVFLTEAEAQAKLDEMKGGADKYNG